MPSKYLTSLSKAEYDALTRKLHQIQGGKCFICGKDIDIDVQSTNIDHIIPQATNGPDNETNFALTHEECNKSKQDANLEVARALAHLKTIQEKVSINERRNASLKDLLVAEGGSKYDFSYKLVGDDLVYSFDKLKDLTVYHAHVFTDALSGEKTAFIQVPIEYVYHDEIINPRGINNSINLLVKEFYKKNPQLHLTLARIDGSKIKVFDGQHKAVAQILLGQRTLLLRLFIDANVDRLIETNANAGSKLRQIAFDKSIMRQLNNTLYQERVKKYQVDHNLKEDDFSFSEQQLCDYFKGENIKKYIIDAVKSAITYSPDNKMRDFIDFDGKGKSLPISHSTYDKVFMSYCIDSKKILTTNLSEGAEDGKNARELEIAQVAKFLSIISETLYIGKFNPEIGVNRIENKILEKRDTEITDAQLIAYRMSKEEIVYSWAPYLFKVIQLYFINAGINYEPSSLFQTPFPDQVWENLKKFMTSLYNLPLWKDRTMAGTHFSGKKNQEFWKVVFDTGKTPEGVSVLSERLNYIEMIK